MEEPNPANNQEKVEMALKEVYKDGILVNTYTYDVDGNLFELHGYGISGDTTYGRIYKYFGDTLFMHVDANFSSSGETQKFFLLNDDTIQRASEFNGQTRIRNYIYEDDKCSYTKIVDINVDGNVSGEYCITFDLENNCSYDYYIGCSSEISASYIKDDKNHYEESAVIPIFKERSSYTNLGNDLSAKWYSVNGSLDSLRSFNSTYNYNDNDYPIEETRTFLNGTKEFYEYVYY